MPHASILHIIVDDLRLPRPGADGLALTPHLAELSRRSLAFEQAFAQASPRASDRGC